MKVVLSHPTGNRNVRAVLDALTAGDNLVEFDTTIVGDPSSLLLKLLPAKLKQEWLRRSFHIDKKKINNYPLLELCRLLFPKIGLGYFTRPEYGLANIDAVYTKLDENVGVRLPFLQKNYGADAVYAYEDGALAIFTRAKALGMKCIYDLPIAYWETARNLMEEEALRMPEWANTLGGGIMDSAEKLERKCKELELADLVMCPSKFVIDSLPKRAESIPTALCLFGSPERLDAENRKDAVKNTGKALRVLFAGSMGQRKGLGDLFEAVKLLNRKDIELVVMGSLLAPMEFYKKELPDFTYEPNRSNAQVLALMRSCDVFCLPSIVEGRALVMQEAMSQGLPIIITPNTGGKDLVIEGKTGFMVPIRSPEKLAEKIGWFLDNRLRVAEMGKMAQQHATSYTWKGYGKNVIDAINTLY